MRRPASLSPADAESVKAYYRDIEDYDWIPVTDRFLGLESILHRFRERETKRLVRGHAAGRMLDAGCGTGLMLRHLPPGSVGLDINPRHAARARRHAPHAEVVLGDVEHPPFPSASFGTILCTEVLEHLPHPERALAEFGRLLVPGGILIGSTPRRGLLWRLRFLSSTGVGDEPFHHEYGAGELRSLFADWEIRSLRTAFFGAFFFFILGVKKGD